MVLTGGHLLHVGYPKTGSKFLQRWLAAHPDIAFAHWGIAGFEDAHGIMAAAAAGPAPAAWRATSHEALLTPLADYRDLGARGVSLPTRAAQSAACAMLAALFPSAHVLIVTRGYEALLRSFYAELVVGGASYTFADFCDALLAQVEAGADAFDFDCAIQAYSAAFGPDRLLVLPYELLRDRPAAFLGAIEESLAISPLRFPPDRVRPSPPDSRLAAYRRLTGWVRALPGPAGLRRSLAGRYVAALRAGRLDGVAAAVGRLGGPSGGADQPVPSRLLEALRGRGGRLRDDPRYPDYAPEYLL
jgi:hypothetical protein